MIDTDAIRRALANGHYGDAETAADIRGLLELVAELRAEIVELEADIDEEDV